MATSLLQSGFFETTPVQFGAMTPGDAACLDRNELVLLEELVNDTCKSVARNDKACFVLHLEVMKTFLLGNRVVQRGSTRSPRTAGEGMQIWLQILEIVGVINICILDFNSGMQEFQVAGEELPTFERLCDSVGTNEDLTERILEVEKLCTQTDRICRFAGVAASKPCCINLRRQLELLKGLR
tara:strand:+ start:618 stop:1166 length:549 start_codon:yes stop_codon:yes gene_type:complete